MGGADGSVSLKHEDQPNDYSYRRGRDGALPIPRYRHRYPDIGSVCQTHRGDRTKDTIGLSFNE